MCNLDRRRKNEPKIVQFDRDILFVFRFPITVPTQVSHPPYRKTGKINLHTQIPFIQKAGQILKIKEKQRKTGEKTT